MNMLYSAASLILAMLAISSFIVSILHSGMAIRVRKKPQTRQYHQKCSKVMFRLGIALIAALALLNLLAS